jgi:hypothetical protein
MAKRKMYRFRGNEGKSMDEALVKKWIQQHADHHETKAHFFGREIIEKILRQPDCVGIRIYYAMDNKNQKQLILVGGDERGNNMWPSAKPKRGKKMLDDDGGNTVADMSAPCPPNCPPNSI